MIKLRKLSLTVTLITKALADSVKDVLKRHKQAGNPVVVMKGDSRVWLKPENITGL
jgi:hypothetical protein